MSISPAHSVLYRDRQAGLTLIELIMFIIIVSVAITGILAVMNQVVKSSADPMQDKQAIAFGDAVLEEALSKAYCDPDLVAPACTVSREPSRQDWDDVQDYAGQTIAGTDLLSGSNTALLAGFQAVVAVADATVSGVTMKKVTVTVTAPSGTTYAVSGYRGNY
jgi:MSHA pilin protein MshD